MYFDDELKALINYYSVREKQIYVIDKIEYNVRNSDWFYCQFYDLYLNINSKSKLNHYCSTDPESMPKPAPNYNKDSVSFEFVVDKKDLKRLETINSKINYNRILHSYHSYNPTSEIFITIYFTDGSFIKIQDSPYHSGNRTLNVLRSFLEELKLKGFKKYYEGKCFNVKSFGWKDLIIQGVSSN